MMLAIPFPMIDPVLFELGPLVIRWYALAYIAGIMLGWHYIKRIAPGWPGGPDVEAIDDFVVWLTLGVILGGRLGYVLFYKPAFYLANPLEVLYVWQGGMSFHGGLIGVAAAMVLFGRKRGIAPLTLSDLVSCAIPIGLFFGRIANFINSELWGRPSDVPWAVVFPNGGPAARHPSQLYESFLEGAVLFAVLLALSRVAALRGRRGFLTGAFLVGYGVSRMFVELFRQPDEHLGFLFAGITMGHMLSLPMVAAGLWLMLRAKKPAASRP